MVRIFFIQKGYDITMFIRVHTIASGVTTIYFRSSGSIVINTSQIVSIDLYDSSPMLYEDDKKKYLEKFDTNDLSVFDVTLSTGKNYLIIGPKKAYDNIK